MWCRFWGRVLEGALPGPLGFLAVVLALHGNDTTGGDIFVGIAALSRYLRVHRTHVISRLRELKQLGVLEVEAPGGGRHRTTLYRFVASRLPIANGSVEATVSEPEMVAVALANGSLSARERVAVEPETVALALANGSLFASYKKTSTKTPQKGTEKKKQENQRTRPAKSMPDARECLAVFQQAFLTRFPDRQLLGTPGKDGALMRKLIQAYGEGEVQRIIALYFRSADTRVLASDYTIGGLFHHAPRLHLGAAHASISASPRTVANIESALRASGRHRPAPEDP